jgi:ribosomal protein L11 methyltransferase
VWSCLKFKVAAAGAEALADRLEQLGAIAVTLQAADDSLRFDDPEQAPELWTLTEVCGWFAAETDIAGLVAGVTDLPDVAAVPEQVAVTDRDWVAHSQSSMEPLRINNQLWICPSWIAPPDPSALNIVVDPGRAFGTGQHSTTRMCLSWLAGQALTGRRVLDYGCGSGVLAIAAARLGASEVVGVDIDPEALLIARDNAAKNSVAQRCCFLAPTELAPGRYHMLLANILLRPLLNLQLAFAALQSAGDRIALTGILADQHMQLIESYAADYELQVEYRDEDWILVSGKRR